MNRFLSIATVALVVAFGLIGVFASVEASPVIDSVSGPQPQVTVEPDPIETVVPIDPIPETGGDAEATNFGGWWLWLVLGALLVGLIIALASRPSSVTYHDND